MADDLRYRDPRLRVLGYDENGVWLGYRPSLDFFDRDSCCLSVNMCVLVRIPFAHLP